jgi:hypothetical protein
MPTTWADLDPTRLAFPRSPLLTRAPSDQGAVDGGNRAAWASPPPLHRTSPSVAAQRCRLGPFRAADDVLPVTSSCPASAHHAASRTRSGSPIPVSRTLARRVALASRFPNRALSSFAPWARGTSPCPRGSGSVVSIPRPRAPVPEPPLGPSRTRLGRRGNPHAAAFGSELEAQRRVGTSPRSKSPTSPPRRPSPAARSA